MVDALPLRIFLASPTDLTDERELLRNGILEYNAGPGSESNVSFEAIGWESVRGTARRPQEAINELIDESHFLVAMFKDSWGSDPGGHWGYGSGTEEELFNGLLALGQAEHPMRDIWVVFVKGEDPDGRIKELRDAIKDRHALLYDVAISADHLGELFSQQLTAWALLSEAKVPRQIDLIPSSGKNVLGAQRLRINGEKLVELGQVDAGRAALRESASIGGPSEQLACARFESRHGDPVRAMEEVQRAIAQLTSGSLPLHSPLAAEAFAAEAGLLRKDGRNDDAIGRLDHALTLIDEADPYGSTVRCRILDDLGLAHKAAGNVDLARGAFDRGLAERRSAGVTADIAQSLVNLARLEIGIGNLEVGAGHAEDAADGLRGTAPTSLHANVETLLAQVRLRQGRAGEGIPHAQRSLSIDRQLGNRHGEAIALYVLSQCHRAVGQTAEARERAVECKALNVALGNDTGIVKAQWILDNLE